MSADRSLPRKTSTLVIGGGPAGLVSLKYAVEFGERWSEGEEPILVEMEREIGGTFRWRGYENAELVSSKQLTCFSDFRYPLSAPDHPSLPNFVQYLNDYANHFGISPHIHTSTKVVSLKYPEDPKDGYKHLAVLHRVDPDRRPIGEPIEILAKRVIITTGLHVTPNIPSIPGLNTEPKSPNAPEWIHSSSYKSRSQLEGKEVLILGAGETGMDVAYESIMAGSKKVWLGVRNGFLSFPKVLNNFRVLGFTFNGNLPIDGLITNLFEDTYVHKWVAQSHLRWFISDLVIKRVLWVLTGTMAGCNQWAGELPPERQGRAYVFLNKSAKAMQFINRPFYNLSPLHKLFAHYIDPPPPANQPSIDIVPFPKEFDQDGQAIFNPPPNHREKETAWKTKTCKPDLVVLCTGYKQNWEWLGEGYPRGPEECDIRGVCSAKDLSVGFVGFVRPGVGAIPPIAEMQTQLLLLLSQKRIPIPTSPETYHLLHSPTSRIQYGVDHSTYMSTLSKDIGSSPGLFELWWEYGWFVLFVYCFGAAFPTFYRLTGPFKSEKARGIVETEIWETIQRRGLLGNIFMGVIPMAFYAVINVTAYLIEKTWLFAAPLFGLPLPPDNLMQVGSTAKIKSS
ncbi:uncharacterized protein I303_106227 [Kwoniella dejecticola CBS 10117]|uniref:Dimethylaniline monooxygenase n=1 Tax=Kwoniella dejecticola CBS 10117 TaxID=1296121 RepID=A0A1A6A1M8_9TREE|nr:dimethylaniline monooxygenase [Kwoniella dejecticola CBS 10117]OBR83959.1 dimethylaniline monooxygenase [Kwoniella dejecticola CBS 10117]